jgi:serine/threonine kinase 38
VNWKSHLKFPEEVGLSPDAKDLISRLLCNVNHRLGSKGADEIKVLYGVFFFKLLDLLYYICILSLPLYCIPLQAHRFFNGVEWDKLYHIEAAFIPEVNDELDTQNFEKFDEVY